MLDYFDLHLDSKVKTIPLTKQSLSKTIFLSLRQFINLLGCVAYDFKGLNLELHQKISY